MLHFSFKPKTCERGNKFDFLQHLQETDQQLFSRENLCNQNNSTFFYCPFWIKNFNCWRAFNSAHFPFTQLLIWTVYYDSICSASVGFLLFAFAGYGGHSYFVIPKSNNKNKINMNIFENSKLHGTMLRFNTWTHNDGNFSKVIEFHEKIFHRNRETFKVW